MPIDDHYQSPIENHTALRDLAREIAGPPGTAAHALVLNLLMNDARSGKIELASECNEFPASTVDAATAAAEREYWKPYRSLLDTLRDGTKTAIAVSKGKDAIIEAAESEKEIERLRVKVDMAQQEGARLAEDENNVNLLVSVLVGNLIRRVISLDPRYQGEHGERALFCDIESDTGRDLWGLWVGLSECYLNTDTAPAAPAKPNKKRGSK